MERKWPENWTKEIGAVVESRTYPVATDWGKVDAGHKKKLRGIQKTWGALLGGFAMAAVLVWGILTFLPQPATGLEAAVDKIAGDFLWGTSDMDTIFLLVAEGMARE